MGARVSLEWSRAPLNGQFPVVQGLPCATFYDFFMTLENWISRVWGLGLAGGNTLAS